MDYFLKFCDYVLVIYLCIKSSLFINLSIIFDEHDGDGVIIKLKIHVLAVILPHMNCSRVFFYLLFSLA